MTKDEIAKMIAEMEAEWEAEKALLPEMEDIDSDAPEAMDEYFNLAGIRKVTREELEAEGCDNEDELFEAECFGYTFNN